jgi:hypothetical protein
VRWERVPRVEDWLARMADSAITSSAAKIGAAERTASVRSAAKRSPPRTRSPTGVIDAWPRALEPVAQPAAVDVAGELEAAERYALAGLAPATARA